jgi:hypothetical protein
MASSPRFSGDNREARIERFADRFGQPCGTHYYADRTDDGAVGASHYYSDRVETDADLGDRSDERLVQLVGEALHDDDQLDASGIIVGVTHGEVVLDGTVADHRVKRMAEDVALRVRGVRDVQNRIRISPPLTKE